MSPVIKKLKDLLDEVGSIEAQDMIRDAIRAERAWEQSEKDQSEPEPMGREADFIMTEYEKRVSRFK